MAKSRSFRRSVELKEVIDDMQSLYDSEFWTELGYDKQARMLMKYAIKRIKAEKISVGSLIETIGE